MKAFRKVFGITIIVGVIALLVFGAVNRTLAKSEDEIDFTSEVHTALEINNGPELDVMEAASVEASNFEQVITPDSLMVIDTLNQDELDALLYMREEEKLARDVYLYLANQWALPAFSNIAKSEQVHMDSLLELINLYGLPDSASEEVGVFNNADLQALYNKLIAQGSLTVEDAFIVGAAIEEIDILDLQVRLSQTDQADIQLVFNTLMLGSYNHLNAFVGNLSNRYGITYSPQYISNDHYLQILATDTGGGGNGLGSGGGSGFH